MTVRHNVPLVDAHPFVLHGVKSAIVDTKLTRHFRKCHPEIQYFSPHA